MISLLFATGRGLFLFQEIEQAFSYRVMNELFIVCTISFIIFRWKWTVLNLRASIFRKVNFNRISCKISTTKLLRIIAFSILMIWSAFISLPFRLNCEKKISEKCVQTNCRNYICINEEKKKKKKLREKWKRWFEIIAIVFQNCNNNRKNRVCISVSPPHLPS